jgi:tRNA dimethylallyltransferase
MNSTSNLADTELPTIPALVGPTAIGKTSIALELADRLNLELVSCDSRQIYKHLSIGTAKPTAEELAGRPCHLIDYVEPTEVYSAAKYREAAEAVIADIRSRGLLPLIVGGTGLYLRALRQGFFRTPEPDIAYRQELEELATKELHHKLQSVDPNSAAQIEPANRIRIIRALEIHKLTGKTKSQLAHSGTYPARRYKFRLFGLTRYRQKLYQIINSRVDKMVEEGLFAEVESLVEMGYGNSPVLLSSIGYREVLWHFDGKLKRRECVELIAQRHRNYAKRQITWFRREPQLEYVDLDEENSIDRMCREIGKLKLDS